MIVPAWFLWVTFGLAGGALVFALIRAFIGPTTPDRLAAVDNMTTIITSAILLSALVFGSGIYIDVGLVYAILSFIGVIVFARYLEGGP
ncbi:MAG: monovalent cation/H+ antiporter complex subunit F [Candidatus Thermoplasmatota archaeon]|nr:monovalent cation/H+ antiporter complex subunit F [Candidatus Thermoplasmatota archaeon]